MTLPPADTAPLYKALRALTPALYNELARPLTALTIRPGRLAMKLTTWLPPAVKAASVRAITLVAQLTNWPSRDDTADITLPGREAIQRTIPLTMSGMIEPPTMAWYAAVK